LRKQRQRLQRQRTSTPCTTTVDASLPRCLHQGTMFG
jgi:hypothetical protein